MKVGLLGNIKDNIINEIESFGYKVDKITKDDIKNNNYSKDYDILCGSMLFKKIKLDEFKNLKYIFLFSQGIDYMPLNYIKENNIIMTNNKGAYAEPIGEFIVYSLLAMEKFAYLNLENQKLKKWAPRSKSGDLYNKKILFLGTGDISSEAAKRLQGFDMKIAGYNTNGRNVKYFDYCVDEAHLDKELENCDYLVMVLPSTEKTMKFMNERRFSILKEGVKFINVARGDVVDEEALIKYLKNGKISSAALDVFEKEPLSQDNALWEMENVYITPHISGVSEDNEERFTRNVMLNLKNLSEGKEIVNLVNLDRKY